MNVVKLTLFCYNKYMYVSHKHTFAHSIRSFIDRDALSVNMLYNHHIATRTRIVNHRTLNTHTLRFDDAI